uniref:Uncharacterized protein n=1 Tax=Pipistrellus kuhlii TaxID=59472 RepID=A0A7J7QYG4_PIPKU|nr:hypothetical protein mPipKuh1_008122 [Pipistrellus kuhlii]
MSEVEAPTGFKETLESGRMIAEPRGASARPSCRPRACRRGAWRCARRGRTRVLEDSSSSSQQPRGWNATERHPGVPWPAAPWLESRPCTQGLFWVKVKSLGCMQVGSQARSGPVSPRPTGPSPPSPFSSPPSYSLKINGKISTGED